MKRHNEHIKLLMETVPLSMDVLRTMGTYRVFAAVRTISLGREVRNGTNGTGLTGWNTEGGQRKIRQPQPSLQKLLVDPSLTAQSKCLNALMISHGP